MAKYFYTLVAAFISINLLGCATQFTEASIESLRIGMPSTEIKEMFGSPNRVRSSVCGASTPKGAWVCETWTYETMRGTNNFTFSVKPEGRFLNDWTVNK